MKDLTPELFTKYSRSHSRLLIIQVLSIISFCMMILFAYHGAQSSAQTAAGSGSPASTSGSGAAASGSASKGEEYFTRVIPLQNGGPPCMACHNVSGLAFPGGGSLGPDLTGIASKFGAGLIATLSTLPFPTMIPIFGKRPLSAAERQDLSEFFKNRTGPVGPNSASKIVLPAIGGLIVLIILIWLIWRNRLITVRRALVSSGGVRS